MPVRKRIKPVPAAAGLSPASSSPSGETAADLRAVREGWTAPYRKARDSAAVAMKTCRRYYQQIMPDSWQFMALSAWGQIRQAINDCRRLDELREERGLPPVFMEKFTVQNNKALEAIHYRAAAEIKALHGNSQPWFASARAGDMKTARAKRLAEQIRDSIRDGWSLEAALELHSEIIGEMAERQNVQFFVDLGEMIRTHRNNPYTRDLIAWILRAWLPLCLWE